MYPDRELKALAVHKDSLTLRISLRRAQFAEDVYRVSRPLEFVDHVRSFLNKIEPIAMFAALPIGILAGRNGSRPMRILGSIARWLPLAFGRLPTF
jgi:hypothetical protein